MTRLSRWLLLFGCGLASNAFAHPLAPALLELRETGEQRYEILWRASALQTVGLQPQFPSNCRPLTAPQFSGEDSGAVSARWTLHCAEGLAGQVISVPRLEEAGINVILRLERLDGGIVQALLDSRQPDFTVPVAALPVFPSYLQLGIEHLLFGFDHLLFVAGLVLLVRRLRPLLVTVTAFTLGHSLTLSLAALGLIDIDPAFTELAIAASILVLACELARQRASWPARRAAALAAGFGLLHGLGFAGALAQIGLPQNEIPLALFAFNLGIELGQIAWIAALLLLAWLWRALPRPAMGVTFAGRALPAYLIGTLAAFWCFERVADLFA